MSIELVSMFGRLFAIERNGRNVIVTCLTVED